MKARKISADELQSWQAEAINKGLLKKDGINFNTIPECPDMIYKKSVKYYEGILFALVKTVNGNRLMIVNDDSIGFSGHSFRTCGLKIWFCPTTHENAVRLRKLFPFTAPSSLKNIGCTIGLGDRLGIASAGHIRIINRFKAAPVLAQQSVRELELTKRDYAEAIDSASWAVFQEGYEKPWGADGDHLKTSDWVKTALKSGCTMITADLSEYILDDYSTSGADEINAAYQQFGEDYRKRIESEYLETEIRLANGHLISFNAELLKRIVLIYSGAVDFAGELYSAGKSVRDDFDFEISIDETESSTLPEAHYFVAKELNYAGVDYISLAPRFVGEFQKGIDYIGDIAQFESEFTLHSEIAEHLGTYKISVHSGSDKFSVFPIVGRETNNIFHLKTSGTNWLQALQVVAEKEPLFFKELYNYSLEIFSTASKYYHVTPELDNLEGLKPGIIDLQPEKVLENPNDRRVLHIAYGEILKIEEYKLRLFEILNANISAYWESLEKHIGRHAEMLGMVGTEE